jgi:DNA-3-methyladenine glycosylase II
MRIIATPDDVADGVSRLVAIEPRFAAIVAATGLPPLRRAPAGFAGLAAIIVEQQISLHAAAAILKRLKQAVEPLEPAPLLAAGEAVLAAAGLSRAKVSALTALARAVEEGSLDLDALARLDDAEALACLVSVHGIGPWTAEIYLLTCLGRPDVWPAGDVALQTATGEAMGLAARPDRRAMVALAEPWRPWRAVAARLLWAHYRRARFRTPSPGA